MTDVDIDIAFDTDVLATRFAKVEVRRDGEWIVVIRGDRVRAARGSTLPLRVSLKLGLESDAASKRARLDATISKRTGRAHIHLGNDRACGGKASNFDELAQSIEDRATSSSVGGHGVQQPVRGLGRDQVRRHPVPVGGVEESCVHRVP